MENDKAVEMTQLSCHRFLVNEVRLWLCADHPSKRRSQGLPAQRASLFMLECWL